jgi:hypothetical protein
MEINLPTLVPLQKAEEASYLASLDHKMLLFV